MDDPPFPPSLPWRFGSAFVMGVAGLLARAFYMGLNNVEVHGLDNFLELLDRRKDVDRRERGLLTISNHICVIDDPLIWGILPLPYHFNPSNHRWGLGAHDICFRNAFTSHFFSLGQTLPTHRLMHSPHGGPFQPSLTEAIRLLSRPPFTIPSHPPTQTSINLYQREPGETTDLSDPFTHPTSPYTYTTNGHDSFPAPSAFANCAYSWVHIFPEGRVHQHPRKTMRYFKWGVARLILEPEVCPDIVPIWISGNNEIMHEAREWPRFVPRAGKCVGVRFGGNVGGEGEGNVFCELRGRWRALVERNAKLKDGWKGESGGREVGVLDEELRYGREAVQLRIEVTRRVRQEVLRVRRESGLPDEDPKEGLVETWREEGGRERKKEDGSLVGDV